jgi:hypothetical protein
LIHSKFDKPKGKRRREMKPTHEHAEIANKYAGEECTLDGKPARICGRLLRFAIVREIFGPSSAEFAWETIKHCMEEKNGEFHT